MKSSTQQGHQSVTLHANGGRCCSKLQQHSHAAQQHGLSKCLCNKDLIVGFTLCQFCDVFILPLWVYQSDHFPLLTNSISAMCHVSIKACLNGF